MNNSKKNMNERDNKFAHLVGYLVQDIVGNEHDAANFGDEKKPTSFFVEEYLPKFKALFSEDKPTSEELSLEDFKKKIEESNAVYAQTQERFNKMFESMDAKAIADHKAQIDEREYWRKLRGDIALKLLNKYESSEDVDPVFVSDITQEISDELYRQDINFRRKEEIRQKEGNDNDV